MFAQGRDSLGERKGSGLGTITLGTLDQEDVPDRRRAIRHMERRAVDGVPVFRVALRHRSLGHEIGHHGLGRIGEEAHAGIPGHCMPGVVLADHANAIVVQ